MVTKVRWLLRDANGVEWRSVFMRMIMMRNMCVARDNGGNGGADGYFVLFGIQKKDTAT